MKAPDEVVPLILPSGIDVSPESGVPAPVLLQSELSNILIYRGYGTIVARFNGCSVTKFGYPNDEALAGHPLYTKGLGFYGAFEVKQSTWIATLSWQNKVRFPNSDPFCNRRHFVITFHDSTFECIANSVTFEQQMIPLHEVLQKVTASGFAVEFAG